MNTQALTNRTNLDNYLTNNPTFDPFNMRYKTYVPHTKSIEEHRVDRVGFSSTSICNIYKNADLITDIQICITLPELPNAGWVNAIGEVMIKSYSFKVQGKTIFKADGEWLEWWSEHHLPSDKKAAYWEMIGKREPTTFKPTTLQSKLELIFPLQFQFTDNLSCAFPICGIDSNDIEVEIEWNTFNNCYIQSYSDQPPPPPQQPTFEAYLIVEYGHLMPEKRIEFTGADIVQLIERVHKNIPIEHRYSSKSPLIDLDCNELTKSLFWAIRRKDTHHPTPYHNDWFNYTCYQNRRGAICDPLARTSITIGGETTVPSLTSKYFRLSQPYTHSLKVPQNYIYSYHFTHKSYDKQPCGHINLHNLKKNKLRLQLRSDYNNDYEVIIYSITYNWIIIKNKKIQLLYGSN